MREFASLYAELDATTATGRKLEALQAYFSRTEAADAAWAVYFLAGGKPRQAVPTQLLRQCAMQYAQLDEWLFDECYQAVGDLAETIAHILPPGQHQDDLGLAYWMRERIAPLRGAEASVIRAALFSYWGQLDWQSRFLLTKLIGGGFRVGVSKLLVTRALAAVAQVDASLIAQRLVGWTDSNTQPAAQDFRDLIAPASEDDHRLRKGQPYPFFLAHPLLVEPATLGALSDWQAEWKYDGIRAQLVHRGGRSWLWSRGEELISERFPELARLPLPDGTVIDGEIVIFRNSDGGDGGIAPFADLQKRIGRKTLSPKMLADLPAVLIADDVLEWQDDDVRDLPQYQRRTLLEQIIARHPAPALHLAPVIDTTGWPELAALRDSARERGVEGMMLKAKQAHYGIGRTKNVGTWWKWKVDPYSVDAVLIYAQHGHGRRASLYTDYTFAVWDDAAGTPLAERKLVPFAKAYSGLTDEEIARIDKVIRKTTVEKFGPVRSVTPSMVFEIGFEGIAASARHKAGIAVRFPRILRIREDKPVADADTLSALKSLLDAAGSPHAPQPG